MDEENVSNQEAVTINTFHDFMMQGLTLTDFQHYANSYEKYPVGWRFDTSNLLQDLESLVKGGWVVRIDDPYNGFNTRYNLTIKALLQFQGYQKKSESDQSPDNLNTLKDKLLGLQETIIECYMEKESLYREKEAIKEENTNLRLKILNISKQPGNIL